MAPLRIALLLVLLTLAVAGAGGYLYRSLEPSTPQFASRLPEPQALPAFSLIDNEGEPFDNDSLTGDWHLLFFGFTHCPDICPATLQQLAIARSRVLADGGTFPTIVLVSVDPERDAPAVLDEWIDHFGDGVVGVTGELEQIRVLTTATGIYFAKNGVGDSDYGVDHSAHVLLLDDAGRWQALFRPPHSVDAFVADVPLLMKTR